MNLPLFIAGRYLFAKKSHNVINIISAISCIGMAVGTAALIIILSVYNGFENLVSSMVSDIEPDLLVTPAFPFLRGTGANCRDYHMRRRGIYKSQACTLLTQVARFIYVLGCSLVILSFFIKTDYRHSSILIEWIFRVIS